MLRCATKAGFLVLYSDRGAQVSLSPVLLCTRSSPKGGFHGTPGTPPKSATALYPILRPVLGLVALVVLNRTNILSECNTGHHSAELMNRALFPLFETSILSTDSYRSMHIGRLCGMLDSFIGRGYKLSAQEIAAVQTCCIQLEKAV